MNRGFRLMYFGDGPPIKGRRVLHLGVYLGTALRSTFLCTPRTDRGHTEGVKQLGLVLRLMNTVA